VELLIPWRPDGDPWRVAGLDWCVARWERLFPDWRIVLNTDGATEGWFNIARALNRCIDASTAEVCIMVGADTILNPDKVLEAVAFASDPKPCWVMMCDTLNRLDKIQTERVLAMEPGAPMPAGFGRRRVAQLGWGPICAPRHLLLERLWDERMIAGGEDDTFGIAAETLWGAPARVVQSPCFMLHHGRQNRHLHELRQEAVELKSRYLSARWQVDKMWALKEEWQ
jgi:hypothetical protein